MNRPEEKNHFYASVLFLIWPLLAVFSAFKHYKKPWAKNIAWAFIAFFGFTFAIGSASENTDIVRYVAEFKALHKETFSFSKTIDHFIASGEIDILKTLIAVVFSRFTDSQAVLTGVYGIIFGYFFSRNMWYVLERLEGKIKPYTMLLFACFFLAVPIWYINGFRMWTATHIFLFGLLPYLCEGEKKGLWISALAVLVHFSFIVPVSILLGYTFLGPRITLYFGFYIVTFFISEINLELINRYVEAYTPEIFQERTKYYRREEDMEEMQSGAQRSWHILWYTRALGWAVMGYMVILFLQGRELFKSHEGWRNLMSFTLLFFGAANILSLLPSGARFLNIARLIALALITLYIHNIPGKKLTRVYKLVALPAVLFFILVSVRIGLISISATSILGNPIVALYTAGDTMSMNEFLMMVLRNLL
ncbi:MAG: EpsG family protein [Balneolaceae bacterium]|nr:EpsG family protein [Balneolaceae bacterium]